MKYARPLIDGETVQVHKNLNTGKWSVKARIPKKGFQVVAHLDTITILNAIPKISLKGVQRIRTNKVRSVVARIEGTYSATPRTPLDTIVRYNPYKNEHFTTSEGIFQTASVAVFSPQQPHFTI